MTTDTAKASGYRWVVLMIAWLTLVCVGWQIFLIPALGAWLFPDLHLTLSQFVWLFTAPTLVAAFTSLPGGALGDRYGIRIVVAITAFLAAGLGLARVLCSSFEPMLAIMLTYGICFGFVIPNLPKLVGIWFPPHQIGLASGIYMTGLGLGTALGLMTGPLFGGWKPAFTYIGLLTLAVAVLWTVLGRNAPAGVKMEMPPMTEGIKKGLKSKNIWLTSFAGFLMIGAFISLAGNVPHALEHVHEVAPAAAGVVASLITWGFVLGNFVVPIVSDKVGLRKPFMYVSAIIGGICFYFAWAAAPGAATSVLMFVGGFFIGGLTPILMALPVELPEIGHQYVGGAAGVFSSVMNAGGFLIPIYVITPIAAAGTAVAYNNAFLAMGIICAAIAVPTILVKETGARARKK